MFAGGRVAMTVLSVGGAAAFILPPACVVVLPFSSSAVTVAPPSFVTCIEVTMLRREVCTGGQPMADDSGTTRASLLAKEKVIWRSWNQMRKFQMAPSCNNGKFNEFL